MSTDFSISFNVPIVATISDVTVLSDPITENIDYGAQKGSCVVYNEMSAMNPAQFNDFFGTTTTRAVYLKDIQSKLQQDRVDAGGVTLGSRILTRYNNDRGLTGVNRKERINWTVDLTPFDNALNNCSVVNKFVAGANNHFQLIFRFQCGELSYPVGFEWKMIDVRPAPARQLTVCVYETFSPKTKGIVVCGIWLLHPDLTRTGTLQCPTRYGYDPVDLSRAETDYTAILASHAKMVDETLTYKMYALTAMVGACVTKIEYNPVMTGEERNEGALFRAIRITTGSGANQNTLVTDRFDANGAISFDVPAGRVLDTVAVDYTSESMDALGHIVQGYSVYTWYGLKGEVLYRTPHR